MYVAFNKYVYGFVHWLDRKGLLGKLTRYYEEDQINFPDDWQDFPTELEARIGLVQLEKYDGILQKRIKRVRQYIEKLKDQKDIEILPFMDGATYSHFVGLVQDRQAWQKRYDQKGIQLGQIIEYCVPSMKSYSRNNNSDQFPVATYYWKHIVNFPNYPE